ncbi:hypothetical protein ACIOHS_11500 [Streptomyces sp. NPDC088253]|uniref:hypothetical protein n=1 Tax=Streptomyces sp. NPDC088253 TaxID=3365846 RepID=UPI0037F5AC41
MQLSSVARRAGARCVYVEANGISPDRALRIDIGGACRGRGIVMVDGSIIGAPPPDDQG